MSADPTNLQAPIPRDQLGPTESELIPFKSTKINIWKSKALLPLILVALAVVALFATMDTPLAFIKVFGWIGVISIFLGIYFYAGIQKQWWWYFVPALIAWILLQYAFDLYALFFRHVLPGNVSAVADNPNFIPNFIAYFFGAGMCEEGLKATPALIALALTLRRGAAPTGPTPGMKDILNRKSGGPQIIGALAMRGPLDGVLMGFAAGAAFIIDETLGEYVPGAIERVFSNSHDQGLALFAGLELLIPRILQGVSGHMAWAGIFGYFIGLAARYPRRWIQLVAIGYATAAVLHGLWDSIGTLPFPAFWEIVVSVATVLIFVGCLLKAKQLEIAWGGVSSFGDSILVGAPSAGGFGTAAAPSQPAATTTTSSAGGLLAGLQGLASGLEAVAGGIIKPAAPPVAQAPIPAQQTPTASITPPVAPAASIERYSIGTGTTRFALEAGHVIDFGALFGANSVPTGATGEISRHPTDPQILGLRNTGTSAWTSTTQEGATITVPPGKNLKITAGTRIMLGPLALDIQTY